MRVEFITRRWDFSCLDDVLPRLSAVDVKVLVFIMRCLETDDWPSTNEDDEQRCGVPWQVMRASVDRLVGHGILHMGMPYGVALDAALQAPAPFVPMPRPRGVVWLELRRLVLERDGHACRYCGATDGVLHVDHVVPLALGGDNEPDNLVAACQTCNVRKNAKLLEEWQR